MTLEQRILDAMRTLRAMPDREARFLRSYRPAWPDFRSDPWAYGYADQPLPRFRPTPAQISDCLPALELCRGLDREQWRIVWWRSLGYSFAVIAARLRCCGETARRRYLRAMRYINQNMRQSVAARSR